MTMMEVVNIKKIWLKIIIVISIVGIFYSGYSLYKLINHYHVSAKKYGHLEELYEESRATSNISTTMSDFNEDYVGWLTIKNTNINYPVVHGENNEFYLTHDFYQEEDFAGAIFMDYKNTGNQLDTNIILYGHNMKDGSMFGSLKKYLDTEFYLNHRFITFEFLDKEEEWEVFSVYTTTDTDWMDPQITSTNENPNIKELQKRSQVEMDVTINENDTFLTLATCTIDDEQRFIVHAKRL